MPNFLSGPGGVELENAYLKETDILDRYVGNQLWLWGLNANGQLGDSTFNTADRSSPVQTIARGTDWQKVVCGHWHTVALKTDGTLWNWGRNSDGQLGATNIVHRSSPVQTVSGGTNWKEIAAARNSSFSIKTDGTLWCWGDNVSGELGDGTRTSRSSPVQTIAGGTNWKQVSAGFSSTGAPIAAIKTDGTLWTWGGNTFGALGDNSVVHRSSPVQTIAGGTNWKQVDCGERHVGAIKTDDTLWLWGYNNIGQLGDGTITNRSSPVQTVSGGTNWKQVACGDGISMAIKTDGTLWGMGRDSNEGGVGTNTGLNYSSPVQTVSGGTNWKQVSVGTDRTAAIKTDGSFWIWGDNVNGELGNGSSGGTQGISIPTKTIGDETNFKTVENGSQHVAVILLRES